MISRSSGQSGSFLRPRFAFVAFFTATLTASAPYRAIARRISSSTVGPIRSIFGMANAASAFGRSEEHTSELQSLMRNSYAVFCLKKQIQKHNPHKDKK